MTPNILFMKMKAIGSRKNSIRTKKNSTNAYMIFTIGPTFGFNGTETDMLLWILH